MPVPKNLRPIAVTKRVRHNLRVAARLVRAERLEYAGALHPSMWRRGFLSSRLYSYPGIQDPSAVFINDARHYLRSRNLNTDEARFVLEHKSVFADMLAARGLGSRAPEVYGTVTAEGLLVRSAAAHERLRKQAAVVLKPTTGRGGTGVRIVSPAEVVNMVANGGTDLLVQERVVQHPDLARIYPGSLNTLRVLAVRLPGHGVTLAAAIHRWGAAGTDPVDNMTSGGLCSRVDLVTGRLGPAFWKVRDRRREEFDQHPDTGAQITGTMVPDWEKVRALTLELMDVFPELSHVGWDLAVSDRGVQILEGNGNQPAVCLFQYHGSFLDDPRLVEYYTSQGLLPPSRQRAGGVSTGPRC